MLSNPTNNILECTNSFIVFVKVFSRLLSFFLIMNKEILALPRLNHRIDQCQSHVTIDECDHVIKMTAKNLEKIACTKMGIYLGLTKMESDALLTPNPVTRSNRLVLSIGIENFLHGIALNSMFL